MCLKKDNFYRFNETKKIKDVLKALFKEKGMSERIDEFKAVNIYNGLTDELILKSEAKGIQNGKLFVEVENSGTSNLLSLKKNEIIEKINEKTSNELVKDIIFISK